ncbi:hypothetical protein TREES_T100005082 [Tupaia chinensis]|uniref:Uncharacterized protein n=1 Tax=Tupaia chinensis TaxID=246437 RepID=L9L2E0_TUPCH|nr:hypothetical protein TREES_T100005082 [Tupaia chinensis]
MEGLEASVCGDAEKFWSGHIELEVSLGRCLRGFSSQESGVQERESEEDRRDLRENLHIYWACAVIPQHTRYGHHSGSQYGATGNGYISCRIGPFALPL